MQLVHAGRWLHALRSSGPSAAGLIAAAGLVAQVAVLDVLASTTGLSPAGWFVGLLTSAVASVLLARAISRAASDHFGPANLVTLGRLTLIVGVAALATTSLGEHPAPALLVVLTSVALVMDAVDGWVARRTSSVTPLGARFDMETDAFLILVMSIYVAPAIGLWVVLLGIARYAFVAAGWVWPWLRRPVPPRYWCKVVAATVSISLAIAMSGVFTHVVDETLLLVSLALLVESFGRDVWWLWGQRQTATVPEAPRLSRQSRRVIAAGMSVMACGLVWFALVAPNEITHLSPSSLLRVPIEGLLVVALVLIVPLFARRMIAVSFGLALGLLTILKLIDMGFFFVLDRPFDPVGDFSYLGSALGVVSDSIGFLSQRTAEIIAIALVFALVALMTVAVMRAVSVASRHRRASVRTVGALGAVWALCALVGVQVAPGAPIASSSAASMAYHEVRSIRVGIADTQEFSRDLADDQFASTKGKDLLTALHGKNVLLVFVESYGQSAVQGSSFSPGVDAVLRAGDQKLQAHGFSTKSAFLTSPTFGGISWLAHSTLQSGVWVDSQTRYDRLLGTDRLTLSRAFRHAGWRTVSDVPSDAADWPEGQAFYQFRKMYDERNVGYQGPSFSYASMPDQFSLKRFNQLELQQQHQRPVMAELDLVTSHTPWAPLPQLVPWRDVGDGSVFDGMPEQGDSATHVWQDTDRVRAAYGQSIEYTMSALTGFVDRYANRNTVLIVLGDHQPSSNVSGESATHNVPISIIAKDPDVMKRISSWHWDNGLRPGRQAPTWPMDSFRDNFLSAFSPAAPAH